MEACSNPQTLDPDACPALPPPTGVIPMDPNAYSLEKYVVATTVVCLTLSISAVIIRVFTKACLLRTMRIEDYSLVLAGVFFAIFAGTMNIASQWGCGKHQWNVSITETMKIAEFVNIVSILYGPPMFFAKFTVLIQIQRIFCVLERNFTYWSIQVLIAANGAMYFCNIVVFIFACTPREAIWNRAVPGKCINAGTFMLSTSAINIVSDLVILIIPLWSISALKLPIKRKVGVSGVFAVGLLAVIACVLRLVFTLHLLESKDMTYGVVPVGCWSQAEMATVILCASFPTFPRFYNFLRGKQPWRSKYSFNSGPSSGSNSRGNRAKARSWNGTTTVGESTRSYIPLEERTARMGACNEGASQNSQAALALEEAPPACTTQPEETDTIPD